MLRAFLPFIWSNPPASQVPISEHKKSGLSPLWHSSTTGRTRSLKKTDYPFPLVAFGFRRTVIRGRGYPRRHDPKRAALDARRPRAAADRRRAGATEERPRRRRLPIPGTRLHDARGLATLFAHPLSKVPMNTPDPVHIPPRPHHQPSLDDGVGLDGRHPAERLPWFMIGLRFGFGFCLAASIYGAVASWITYAIATHQFTVAMQAWPKPEPFSPPPISSAQAQQQLSESAQQAIRNLAPPPPQAKPLPPETTIAPRNNNKCVEQAHGVFDQRYQDCINGK